MGTSRGGVPAAAAGEVGPRPLFADRHDPGPMCLQDLEEFFHGHRFFFGRGAVLSALIRLRAFGWFRRLVLRFFIAVVNHGSVHPTRGSQAMPAQGLRQSV